MEKLSSKKIATIVVVIVALILIFSVTRIRSTNKIDNSSLTGSALTSLDGFEGIEPNLISKTLRFGNRGDEVEKLQSFLTDNGYELGKIDGIFGLKTRKALRSFQEDNDQRPTGVLDPKTRDFINEIIIDEALADSIEEENNTDDTNDPLDPNLNLPDDVRKQQAEEEERRKAEDIKQQEEVKRQDAERKAEELKKQEEAKKEAARKAEELKKKEEAEKKAKELKKQQEAEKNKQESLELLTLKENNTLFKDYACESGDKSEMLTVYSGERIDESTNKKAVYALSDVWSTTDGVNWKKQASNTNMGAGWERMVEKDKNGVVYSFGGKYKVVDNKTVSDNGVYKTTNGVDWTYVGDIPEMDHRYDRSVVYFKDTFWLISSMEGIWSSPTGEKWTKEVTKGPWSGYGSVEKSNAWGYYSSNSLGGYVIDGKMWYLVYDGTSSTNYSNTMKIYSTKDGKNWNDEGGLIDAEKAKKYYTEYFNILPNVNPDPVTLNGEIYIVSSDKDNGKPLVIKTSNGKDWYKVSTSDTKFYKENEYFANVRNYGSVAVFLNKLWHIGGWDLQANTDNNDNINDVWSSSDGVKWENITPKGVESSGPAHRWLAGIFATGSIGGKAEDLQIIRKWNDSGFFTGKDEEKTLLGTWKMTADNDKTNTGDIVISYLGFVGNDYKNYKNVQFSSLESLTKITVLADGVEVGSVSSFKGPFYDSTGSYALPQRITFSKNVTIKAGESVTFTLVADFPVPKYKNFEMRTWLNEIGFKEGYSTPCKVYTEFYFDGYNKFPGKLIGWK
ncbi:hypothetical protein A3C57_01255 [Candidatus Nomurabacteria bacterium RIFCSPHIGHO2_02_FULL_33_12]|nr:MAG: hypothetical protein A3C57_01255 [Candidatus Nomurabacteria bacterium RIFCSPHIGHO2_02_FULL_33_12]